MSKGLGKPGSLLGADQASSLFHVAKILSRDAQLSCKGRLGDFRADTQSLNGSAECEAISQDSFFQIRGRRVFRFSCRHVDSPLPRKHVGPVRRSLDSTPDIQEPCEPSDNGLSVCPAGVRRGIQGFSEPIPDHALQFAASNTRISPQPVWELL